MTFWHWKQCIMSVACLYLMAFVTNIEGSVFIIACWEFPSASIHCWPPLYARVWEGWFSLSNAAWMTDRLVFALCCSICAVASLFCPLGSGCARKQHIFSWPFAFGKSRTITHTQLRVTCRCLHVLLVQYHFKRFHFCSCCWWVFRFKNMLIKTSAPEQTQTPHVPSTHPHSCFFTATGERLTSHLTSREKCRRWAWRRLRCRHDTTV